MNHKKFWFTLWALFLLFVTIQGATAELSDELISYWALDANSSSQADSVGSNTGTVVGATYNGSCKINACYGFDGTGDIITVGTDDSLELQTNNFTIQAWVYTTTNIANNANDVIFASANNDNGYGLIMHRNGNNIDMQKAKVIDQTVAITFNASTWYHIVAVAKFTAYNTPEMVSFYINGVHLGNYTGAGATTAYDGSSGIIKGIGQSNGGTTKNWTGLIDEVSIWNRSLTDNEISELYNNGSGLAYPFAVSTNDSYYYVKITNKWNDSNLEGVNVTLSNGVSNLTQSDGIAYFGNFTGTLTWNATFDDYYNLTGSVEENTTATGEMFQNEVLIYAQELFTSTLITNYSLVYSGTTLFNISGTNSSIFPNDGNWTVSVVDNTNQEIYHTLNAIVEATGLENTTHNVSVHSHHVNVTVRDATNFSLQVQEFNITINSSQNNITTTATTITGLIEFNLTHGNYTFNLTWADGWAYLSVNETKFEEIIPLYNDTTINFSIYALNSVNFTFFDVGDLSTLLNTTNITFDLINQNTSEVNNYSTTTGFFFVENLTAGNYEIEYSATDYQPNSKFFTVTSFSTQTLQLVLSPSTTQYVVRVADNNDDDVVGATLRFQQRYDDLGGQFVTVEECQTNDDGECDIYVNESSDIIYRFIVLIDGSIVKTTTPSNIFTLEGEAKRITIRIDISETNLEELQGSLDLFGDVTWDNDTKIVSFEYVDGANAIAQGCLKVQIRSLFQFTWTTISQDCSALSSATLTKNVSANLLNDTILRFIGFVDYTNHQVTIDTLEYENTRTPSNRPDNLDDDSLLFSAFSVGIVSLVVALIPSLIIQLLLTFGVVFVVVILGFTKLQISVIMAFLVLGIVLAWNNKNTRGQNG